MMYTKVNYHGNNVLLQGSGDVFNTYYRFQRVRSKIFGVRDQRTGEENKSYQTIYSGYCGEGSTITG